MVAPRALARSSVSSTTTAAPSPSDMPVRPFENGRHVSVAMTRIASQPFIVPSAMQASVPPVTAVWTMPDRTMWNAWPIAWVDDEQALATA